MYETRVIKIQNGQPVKKDFLKVENFQIIDGPSPIIIDKTIHSQDDEFFPFNGSEDHSNAGGLFAGIRKNQAKRQARRDLRTKSKAQARVMKAGAKQTKADAKVALATAQQIAAKGLSEADPTPAQAPLPIIDGTGKPKKGLSTGAKIGIAAGIAVVIGVTIFLIVKHHKKGKK